MVAQTKDLFIPMRDGVRLFTRIQFPEGMGKWPVIFGRTPYANALPQWTENGEFWTAQGYVFVTQQCRGTGLSGGLWEPFVNEREDGLDTLEWIRCQEWMNGSMGTYGSSYSGVAQWCMADALPPEVKTMFISVAGIERYHQNYSNGMFRHDIYTTWALGNAGVPPVKKAQSLYESALRVRPHINMDVELFGQELSWYREWVTQENPDGTYWNTGFWGHVRDVPARVQVPIMIVAGWFDHNLEASIRSYHKLPASIRDVSTFIVGPWVHRLDTCGDLDYPESERFGPKQNQAALEWFEHHLKGRDYPRQKGTVETYIIRDGTWKAWNGWIQSSSEKRLYLDVSSQNRWNAHNLTVGNPDRTAVANYDYNPDDPVPTHGGAAIMAYLTGDPAAPAPASVVQQKPGTRQDVVTCISEPLQADITIAGSVCAHLCVRSDVEDTAFTVKVCEVFPDGTTVNIRDGITSLRRRGGSLEPVEYHSGDIVELSVELWPITWTVKEGSCLRVDVSSSNFPAYHAHPNVAGGWAMVDEVKVARQSLYTGGDCSSWISVPTV